MLGQLVCHDRTFVASPEYTGPMHLLPAFFDRD